MQRTHRAFRAPDGASGIDWLGQCALAHVNHFPIQEPVSVARLPQSCLSPLRVASSSALMLNEYG
eukprot:4897791-Prymnesium_polylepis.1